MRDRRTSIENNNIRNERRFVSQTSLNVSCIHANPICQRTSTHIFFERYRIETYVNTVNQRNQVKLDRRVIERSRSICNNNIDNYPCTRTRAHRCVMQVFRN